MYDSSDLCMPGRVLGSGGEPVSETHATTSGIHWAADSVAGCRPKGQAQLSERERRGRSRRPCMRPVFRKCNDRVAD